ncbi:MAG: hypothetical protein WC839_00585 [Candidatus Paceibacterota bacterium]
MKDKSKKILLYTGVVFVILLFAFSLFKNIAYPLLWNDEASTAMFGKRVLEYGYPKAHDEKNYLYYFNDKDHNIGVRSNGDVHIAEGWTQHYLAAFGDYFANKTDNLYTKTAILRIPFALAGFLAIIIFGITISLFFKDNKKKAFIAFFLFELVSISLILHLREVRYYSLIILFSAILINVYLRYTILKTLNYKYYVWITSLFIVLLFHTHYPIAAIFILTFGLHNLFLSYKTCEKKLSIFIHNFFKSSLPLFISLFFIIPSLIYFKTFTMISTITEQSAWSIENYINNIFVAFSFFAKFEFLYLAIFIKILMLLFLYFKRKIITQENKLLIETSNFLSLFFCVYILVIARTVFVFERYVIVLQPILIFIILLDIMTCWYIFNKTTSQETNKKKTSSSVLITIISIAIWINLTPLMEPLKGHLYELTHQYKGPLDFAIPYIQKKYEDPSKIIIATNYEENSYMYYLDSKTIIGYVGNNLEEDKKLEPDIIVFRKFFGPSQGYGYIFDNFMKKNKYKEISFPIFDYPFNNIPELNFNIPHLYKTTFANNDSEKLYLYIKE